MQKKDAKGKVCRCFFENLQNYQSLVTRQKNSKIKQCFEDNRVLKTFD